MQEFIAGQIIPDPENDREHVLITTVPKATGDLVGPPPFIEVTRGAAHATASLATRDCFPGHGTASNPMPLMRRLAFSVSHQAKIMADMQDQNAALDMEHETKLREIRAWLVGLMEDDRLDRDDLDEILAKFGMEPYSQRWVGRVFIEVTLTVDDAKDLDQAEQMAYDWAEAALVDDNGNTDISSPGIASMTYKLEISKD